MGGSDGYKDMCEKAYGIAATIYDTTDGWTTGCSVASEAADASRRSSLAVTFTASITEDTEAAATSATQSLDTATMDSAMASVIEAESLSITAPVTSDVADPTITVDGASPTAAPTTPSASGASPASTVGALAMGAVLMALSRW